MSESLGSIAAITMFVEDRRRSRAFYEAVFAAAPIHEDDDAVAFRLGHLVVNLLERRAAPELVAPAAVAGPGTGARFLLTLSVADTDAACAQLARRGVDLLNGPVDREWGVRTASFTDPDDHVWEVAGPIQS